MNAWHRHFLFMANNLIVVVMFSAAVFAGGSVNYTMLVDKAWDSYIQEDYILTEKYTNQCINDLQEEAKKIQSNLPKNVLRKKLLEDYYKNVALNIYAECVFIKASEYENRGMIHEAKKLYKELYLEYPSSLAGFPGYVWSPATRAKEKGNELEKK